MTKADAASEGQETGEGTDLWLMITAPVIWSVHFVVVYASVAVFCAKSGREAALDPMLWAVGGASAVAIAAILLVLLSLWRVRGRSITGGDLHFEADTPEERHRFLTHVAITLCVLSIIGVLYVSLPILLIDTCR